MIIIHSLPTQISTLNHFWIITDVSAACCSLLQSTLNNTEKQDNTPHINHPLSSFTVLHATLVLGKQRMIRELCRYVVCITYTHVRMCTCTHIHTCTHTHTHTHTHTQRHMYTHTHACTHTRTHKRTNACIILYTNTIPVQHTHNAIHM